MRGGGRGVKGAGLHPAQAGATCPASSFKAVISPGDSPRTTLIGPSWPSVLAKCLVVASRALAGAAIATLKYLNEGADETAGPIH